MAQGSRISFFDFADLGLDQCRHIKAILSPANERVVQLPWPERKSPVEDEASDAIDPPEEPEVQNQDDHHDDGSHVACPMTSAPPNCAFPPGPPAPHQLSYPVCLQAPFYPPVPPMTLVPSGGGPGGMHPSTMMYQFPPGPHRVVYSTAHGVYYIPASMDSMAMGHHHPHHMAMNPQHHGMVANMAMPPPHMGGPPLSHHMQALPPHMAGLPHHMTGHIPPPHMMPPHMGVAPPMGVGAPPMGLGPPLAPPVAHPHVGVVPPIMGASMQNVNSPVIVVGINSPPVATQAGVAHSQVGVVYSQVGGAEVQHSGGAETPHTQTLAPSCNGIEAGDGANGGYEAPEGSPQATLAYKRNAMTIGDSPTDNDGPQGAKATQGVVSPRVIPSSLIHPPAVAEGVKGRREGEFDEVAMNNNNKMIGGDVVCSNGPCREDVAINSTVSAATDKLSTCSVTTASSNNLAAVDSVVAALAAVSIRAPSPTANQIRDEGAAGAVTPLAAAVPPEASFPRQDSYPALVAQPDADKSAAAGLLERVVNNEADLKPVVPAAVMSPQIVVKPKSWASLLQNTPAATNAIVINVDSSSQGAALSPGTPRGAPGEAGKGGVGGVTGAAAGGTKEGLGTAEAPVDASTEEKTRKALSELLRNHQLSHRSVSLQPRGLTNRANWCYVNATLQALLACPPFYHLLKMLPTLQASFWETNKMPVMRSMVEFTNEFTAIQVKSIEKQSVSAKGNMKLDIKCGVPFEPVYIYKMLQAIDYEAFKHGQQEDAEEFLSCILNRLHDEMVAAIKCSDRDGDAGRGEGGQSNGNHGNGVKEGSGGPDPEGSTLEDSRWEQVRSRNRTVYSCVAAGESSPISAIFRGQICCLLHQLGQKESATLQPFFTLQLDIQNESVTSVQEALEQLVSKESLQGYTCTKSKVEVDATRRTLIEELPPVLVLHLKWFTYNKMGGMQKYMKQVNFDVDLELNKDLLTGTAAKSKNSVNHRRYKLFAAVSHIGVRAVGGHYTADIFHPGYNCWVRCDDGIITSVPVSAVTRYNSPKVPYLIFYRRLDLS